MFLSQIACHTIPCFPQPRSMWTWLMEVRNMPKEQGLFYVVLPTYPSYIRQDQFIIVQVTLPKPYQQVTSNVMLVFKRLHLNLLNILILLTLKVVIGDHPTRQGTKQTIFKSKFVKVNPQINRDIVVPNICGISNYFYLILFISALVMYLLID